MQYARVQKPRKKRPPRVRAPVRVRSRKHLQWLKTLKCLVDDCDGWPIDPHHVGDTATSGMALKCDDYLTVPLCHEHHSEGHATGWQTFEAEYDLDLRSAALWFARRSPDPEIRKAVENE